MKRFLLVLLCAALLLTGAGFAAKQILFPNVQLMLTEQTVEQLSLDPNPRAVVARVEDRQLTNAQLQVFYWACVAQAMEEPNGAKIDLRLPLCVQACTVDDCGGSLQEHFLHQALDIWHTAVALTLQGEAQGLPVDPLYAPDEQKHEQLLSDKPATAYMYGYNDGYRLNTLHAEYIAQLPTLFGELAAELGYADGDTLAQIAFGTDADALYDAAEIYNRGYSCFTALSYYLEPGEVTAEGDTPCVSFRQMLLVPQNAQVAEDGRVGCGEGDWLTCEQEANTLLGEWANYFIRTEGMFGQMAFTHSKDEASRPYGGYYEAVVQGQVPAELEGWLFNPDRKAGDTTVIRSDYGVHVLYFSEGSTTQRRAAEDAAMAQLQMDLLTGAKAEYPMAVDCEAVSLQAGEATVTMDAFLYHDVAHQRYPEMPVYLQNDYGDFLYGGYPLETHGCAICSLAMVSSYVSDEEWLPTVLADMFGSYNRFVGTSVHLFWQAMAEVDYYYVGYVYDDDEAWALLEQGYPLIVREQNGYWTLGSGHYITVEKIREDGKVVVRDSSLANFGRLEGHKEDAFDWEEVAHTAAVYLVFGKKAVHNDACVRCGTPDLKTVELIGDSYICPKCDDAILRRTTYLLGT